jgi:hypothetical protein
VIKNVPARDGGYEPRKFSTWSPIAVAGIGYVPDTVADRSITIGLKRKLTSDKVRRLRLKDGAELHVLARKIVRWTSDNEARLRSTEPEPVKELNDRAADAWDPLFTIAEVAGGKWPALARAAAKALAGATASESEEQNVRMLLLYDIRDIFAEKFPPGHFTIRGQVRPPPLDRGLKGSPASSRGAALECTNRAK